MIASVACEVESDPPTSAVDSRAVSAPSTAWRIAAGASGGTCSHSSMSAAERMAATGLATPLPAMSGAEPWTWVAWGREAALRYVAGPS